MFGGKSGLNAVLISHNPISLLSDSSCNICLLPKSDLHSILLMHNIVNVDILSENCLKEEFIKNILLGHCFARTVL